MTTTIPILEGGHPEAVLVPCDPALMTREPIDYPALTPHDRTVWLQGAFTSPPISGTHEDTLTSMVALVLLNGHDGPMPTGGAGRSRRVVLTGPIVGMQCRVRPTTRSRASQSADALGITLGRYVEWLIWRDQLDEDGRPTWADGLDLSVDPAPPIEEHAA